MHNAIPEHRRALSARAPVVPDTLVDVYQELLVLRRRHAELSEHELLRRLARAVYLFLELPTREYNVEIDRLWQGAVSAEPVVTPLVKSILQRLRGMYPHLTPHQIRTHATVGFTRQASSSMLTFSDIWRRHPADPCLLEPLDDHITIL